MKSKILLVMQSINSAENSIEYSKWNVLFNPFRVFYANQLLPRRKKKFSEIENTRIFQGLISEQVMKILHLVNILILVKIF